MGRLTPAQVADRALTGAELQRQITDLAEIYGWTWVHFRAAKTNRGWRVPVEGPLGEGWPDLFLAKAGRGILGIEIKRELGDAPTFAQEWVHDQLRAAGLEVFVFRPSDMTAGRVQAALS